MENNNTVSPELRDEITNKASALVNARNYDNPGWNAGFYEGYETGATKYALLLQQSEAQNKQIELILEDRLTGPESDKYNASDAYYYIAKIVLGNQSGSVIEAVQELQMEVHELRSRAVSAEHEAQATELRMQELLRTEQAQNKQLREALEEMKEVMEWMWDNCRLQEGKEYLQSDLFNRPANAIEQANTVLDSRKEVENG